MEIQEIMTARIRSASNEKHANKERVKRSARLIVDETIDDVLSSLGTQCKLAIYDFLARRHDLNKNDLANHPIEFAEALERILGNAAALIEIQIMKDLHQKAPQFKYQPRESLAFPEYVSAFSRFLKK